MPSPADYGAVIGVVDQWWGGRSMAAMLPKLFFVHFRDTSFVMDDDGEIAGFLCGFRSQTHADEAYIHFVGVDPERRGAGIARASTSGSSTRWRRGRSFARSRRR